MTITEFLLARTAPVCGCVTPGKIVRGMCQPHYDRWLQATPKDQRPPAPRFTREFWDYVDKSGDCWVWTGPTNANGYGWWSGNGSRGLAHRLSLASKVPPQSPGLMACHHCDNPPCVNPVHLYWGDAQTNARDVMDRHGIHNKGIYAATCPAGHLMSGENLRIVGKNGKRFCRTCDNARSRDRQRRKREASRGAR